MNVKINEKCEKLIKAVNSYDSNQLKFLTMNVEKVRFYRSTKYIFI